MTEGDPPSTIRRRPAARAGRLSAARLAAVQALYQTTLVGNAVDDAIMQFLAHRGEGALDDGERPIRPDPALFVHLARGAHARRGEIDDILRGVLPESWPLERIELLLRCVLRAGIYELLADRRVPARVVISEYVDLADAFFDTPERGLTNALLDRLARRLRGPAFYSRKDRSDDGIAAAG